MKIATTTVRILLGFLYLVFGLDYFLHFITYQPNHTGRVAAFKDGLIGVGYFSFNPQAKLGNRWIDLQPLSTEGQGFPEYPDRKAVASKPSNTCILPAS